MVIEQPWDERTDDVIVSLKCLMNGWWLMNPSRNRFKVMDGEGIGPKKAVPSDQVKRTVVIMVVMQKSLLLDLDYVFSLASLGNQLMRRPDITLAIWSVLQ